MLGETIRNARRCVKDAARYVEGLAQLETWRNQGETAARLREAAGHILAAQAILNAVYGTEERKHL